MNKETNVVLEPNNDVIFKRLFGMQKNGRFLKQFLEAILNIKIEKLDLEKETQLLPEVIDEKLGILDVRAELSDGTMIDIEMQKELLKMVEKKNNMIKEANEEYEYLTGDAAVQRIAFLKRLN